MDKIAALSTEDRIQLFRETAAERNMVPAVVEKDFWVCWTLDRLFSSGFLKEKILFKGGTALSKVFGLIERFSEDIDLILDWDEVVKENPNRKRSKNQQDRFNKETVDLARVYLREEFLHQAQKILGDIASASIRPQSPDVIEITYPLAFMESYLRPEIQLEIGPLAAWVPNDIYVIKPYAAEAFPQLFRRPQTTVKAIKAERTFWEKATILHQEAHRPQDKLQPLRYSRHYYDLMRMAQAPLKSKAIADLDLLRDVVAFKTKFYPCSWARYDKAIPGTFKLLPTVDRLAHLKKDYGQMQIMIFGVAPSFDQIIDELNKLENEINSLQEGSGA